MKKRILLLAIVMGMIIALAACNVITPPAATEPTTAPPPPTLYGEWLWLEEVHYIFREDGTGLRGTRAITWVAEDNMLTICSTPEYCEIDCLEPEQWSYVLTATRLTMVYLRDGDIRFTYVRETIE